MTNPKDPQAELREAIQQIFEKRVDEAVKFVNPKYAYHGSYQAAIDEILALFQAREQQIMGLTETDRYDLLTKKQRQQLIEYHTNCVKQLERLQNKTNDGGSNGASE